MKFKDSILGAYKDFNEPTRNYPYSIFIYLKDNLVVSDTCNFYSDNQKLYFQYKKGNTHFTINGNDIDDIDETDMIFKNEEEYKGSIYITIGTSIIVITKE
jgi:hypothetical protein